MSDSELVIDDNNVVTVHYQLTDGVGDLIDSSQGNIPLVYMHNTNVLLPALERELTGKRAGDSVGVTLYPEDAYGYPDEELIAEWPRSAVEKTQELVIGMRFKALSKEGEEKLVTLIEIREDTVLLDANHPLAGKVLNFNVAIVLVRKPTEEELEQGRAETVNSPAT